MNLGFPVCQMDRITSFLEVVKIWLNDNRKGHSARLFTTTSSFSFNGNPWVLIPKLFNNSLITQKATLGHWNLFVSYKRRTISFNSIIVTKGGLSP